MGPLRLRLRHLGSWCLTSGVLLVGLHLATPDAGADWSIRPDLGPPGFDAPVTQLCELNRSIVVAGDFTVWGTEPTGHVAIQKPSGWVAIGDPFPGAPAPRDMVTLKSRVIVAVPNAGIYAWDDTGWKAWTSLPEGGDVLDLMVWHDQLLAATPGGVSAWDGEAWTLWDSTPLNALAAVRDGDLFGTDGTRLYRHTADAWVAVAQVDGMDQIASGKRIWVHASGGWYEWEEGQGLIGTAPASDGAILDLRGFAIYGNVYLAGHVDLPQGTTWGVFSLVDGTWILKTPIQAASVSRLYLASDGAFWLAGAVSHADGKPMWNVAHGNERSLWPWPTAGLPPDRRIYGGWIDRHLVYRDKLVILGGFSAVGDLPVGEMAAWDGTSWEAMGTLPKSPAPFLGGTAVFADTLLALATFYEETWPRLSGFQVWNGEDWYHIPPNDAHESVMSSWRGQLVSEGENLLSVWDGSGWTRLKNNTFSRGISMVDYQGSLFEMDSYLPGTQWLDDEGWHYQSPEFPHPARGGRLEVAGETLYLLWIDLNESNLYSWNGVGWDHITSGVASITSVDTDLIATVSGGYLRIRDGELLGFERSPIVGNGVGYHGDLYIANVALNGVHHPLVRLVSDQVVPVRMLSMSAIREEEGVHLRWEISDGGSAPVFHVYRDGRARDERVDSVPVTSSGSTFEFVDGTPPGGKSYWLQEVDRSGKAAWHGPISVRDARDPVSLRVESPFRAQGRIEFRITNAGPVRLEVHDVRGRLLRSLVSGTAPAGDRAVVWDGRSNSGAQVPPGVYYYRLATPTAAHTAKVIKLP